MAKTYSVKGKIPGEVAQAVAEELVAALPDTQIVGSLRRGCPIVGDVDLLTTSTVAMGLLPMLVDEVFVQGEAKVSGRKGEVQIDLNFTTPEALGSALPPYWISGVQCLHSITSEASRVLVEPAWTVQGRSAGGVSD
jgi:DNA polymerase/3'-5' exonuclease PolX